MIFPSAHMKKLAGLLGSAWLLSTLPAAAQTDNVEGVYSLVIIVLIIAFVALVCCFILLPSFIAFRRRHPNRWLILLVNVVFGATVIGWLGALIWALNAAHKSDDGYRGEESGLNFFGNNGPSRAIEPLASFEAVEAPTVSQDDPAELLTRLKRLHSAGALSDEEYKMARKPLLAKLLQ